MVTEITKKRLTIRDIRSRKGTSAPLVCLTAYTKPMATILDPHCDILLVGDSVGMALYGMDNTLGVTLDMMIAHGKAVMRGVKKSCVLIDMPYGTYESSPSQAYDTARRILDETSCDGVKLEGGKDIQDTIARLSKAGIGVMAHIGLKPQSVLKDGGYRVRGKTPEEAANLMDDAMAVQQAGAFGILIEATIEPIARMITQALEIPTIGIGASPACDGQILVTEDLLGIIGDHKPKFVKQYLNLADQIGRVAAVYAEDVRRRTFPDENYTYGMPTPKGKP